MRVNGHLYRFLCSFAVLSATFILVGCGGGGGGSTPQVQSQLTISGAAQLPQQSGTRIAGRTASAVQGLQNVVNGTVISAYYINDSGTLIGSSIASSTTSGGAFTIKLPQSITSLASNIVVVSGTSANQMRAFVTSASGLKINPLSEYVVNEVISSNDPLSEFTTSELADIFKEVETVANSLNFNFSPYMSVSASISGLNSNTQIAKALDDYLLLVESAHISKAVCGTSAITNVDVARNHIFKSTITESDYNTAKDAVDAALQTSSNCPDANFIGAIVDLIGEANRIGTNVLLTPYDIFPIELEYDVSGGSLNRAIRPLSNPVLNKLPRVANAGTIDENSSPSEIQQEIVSNVMPVLNGVLTKLNKVRSITSSQLNWAFSYPQDLENLELGYESLDKNDVDVLTGALQLSMGLIYYAVSFNLDKPDNYKSNIPCRSNKYYDFNLCSAADTNSDNILTPDEYLASSPFGTLKSDGSTYMLGAKTYINAGLNLLNTSIGNILEETTATVGGLNMTSALLQDIEHYRHYLTEITHSFGGIPTNITIPRVVECWRKSGDYYYRAGLTYDPDYNSGNLSNCVLQITNSQEITAAVDLSAIFNITDFRDVLPDYIFIDNYPLYPQYKPSSSYMGSTIGGILPDGVQSSWFDHEYANINYTFRYLKNSSTGELISDFPESGITLTIDGISLTSYTLLSYSNGEGFAFQYNHATLPKPEDFLTVNNILGTDAVLSVPGYQDMTFTVYGGSHYSDGYTLTPL